MSIRKRTWTGPDGKAKAAWVVDYRHEGKRRLETFRTKGEAKAREAEIAGEKKNGNHVPKSQSPTVKEAGEDRARYLAGYKKLRPSTVRQFRYHLDNYIAATDSPLAGRKVASVTKKDAEDFAIWLIEDKGLSRQTAHKVLVSLKAIMRREGRNVSDWEKLGGASPQQEEPPTVAEVRAMLAKLDELAAQDGDKRQRLSAEGWRRRRTLIATAIHTGMRASELRALRWQDVDLDAGLIHVRQMADEGGAIFPPKSKAGERTIAIPPALVAVLRDWKAEQDKAPAEVKRKRDRLGLVWPTREGNPWPYSSIHQTAWVPLLDKAGLPRRKFHGLRHLFGSRMIAGGANALDVCTAMGHASIKITYDVYGHELKDAEAEQRRAERAATLAANLMAT